MTQPLIQGAVFDVGGVLLRGRGPVPGAAAALADLARRGVRTLVFTNDSIYGPAEWAAILRAAGYDLAPEQILTAGLAAVAWIARHRPGARLFVVGSDSLRALAGAHGLEPVAGTAPAGVVLIGEGQPWDQDLMIAAAERVMAGATLVVGCLDPQIPGETGVVICPGSILGQAVAYAARRRPVVGGKPSAWAARLALGRLGTPAAATVVVGDQVEDMRLARAGGMRGLLVASGLTGANEWRRWPARWHPAAVLPDVTGVLALAEGPRAPAAP